MAQVLQNKQHFKTRGRFTRRGTISNDSSVWQLTLKASIVEGAAWDADWLLGGEDSAVASCAGLRHNEKVIGKTDSRLVDVASGVERRRRSHHSRPVSQDE